jgi:uncharacterized protein (TIGR02266 family)
MSQHPETPTEQRKTPRYELSAYIDCTGSEVYLHHKLLNISLGGICFQCDSPEAVGSEVELLVHFPEIAAQLPCRAQVVWVNRSTPGDMGLRFLGMDDKKTETLHKYLQKVHQLHLAA